MSTQRGTNASGGTRNGVREIELREEMLEGRWMDSLWFEIERQLGKLRQDINGIADTSQNPTNDYSRNRSVCYSPPPLTTGLDPRMASAIGDATGFGMKIDYAALVETVRLKFPALAEQLDLPNMASPMPSDLAWLLGLGMRYWVVCNEVGIFVNYAEGKMIKQRVRSSQMRGMGDPMDPGVPIVLGWNRPVELDGRVITDSWDVWDIRVPSNPTYRIMQGVSWGDDGRPEGGTDITEKVLDKAPSGAAYPWRWTKGERKGQPFIPVVIYHLNYPEQLFDRSTGSELTQGTLTTGVLGSFWLHVCRDVSWPDRNVRGMELVSAATSQPDGPRSTANDPAVVHQWEDDNPEKPGTYWQWQPGADPELLGKAIRSYRQMLDEQSVPADISSVGGDPLAHMTAAIRREVEKLYPICRRYDSMLLEMIAATLNSITGTDYPESGYGLLYRTEIDDLRKMVEEAVETDQDRDAPNA